MARIRTIALTSQRANTPLSTKNGSLRSPTKTSKGARKSTNRTRPPPAPGRCANCKCDEESAKMWRFNGNQNRRLCSKCGIYERDHGGTPRPLTLDHPPPWTSPSISSSVSSDDDEDVRAAASALLGLGAFGAKNTTRKTAPTNRPKDRISLPASLPAFMCSPTIPSIVPPPGMYRLEHSPVRTPVVVESRKRPPPITIPSRSRSRSASSSLLQTPPTAVSCAAPRSRTIKTEGVMTPDGAPFEA